MMKTAREYFVEQAYELPSQLSCFEGVDCDGEEQLWCGSEVVAFAEAYYRYVNSLPLDAENKSVGVNLDKNDEKALGWKDFVRDKIKGNLTKGDYVLATKYSDGDPNDQWAVGFFDHVDERGRYIVVDDEGKSFRISGFRKCEKISSEEGEAILRGEKIIYLCQIGLWEFLERYRRIKNDL